MDAGYLQLQWSESEGEGLVVRLYRRCRDPCAGGGENKAWLAVERTQLLVKVVVIGDVSFTMILRLTQMYLPL